MLNSDDGCRLGPNGLWTRLADRLTIRGYACLRFDYRGCGDSEGPEGPPSGIVGLTDAVAAEQLLRREGLADGTVCVGICYGAEIALLAARRVPTVCGVVACSTGRYVTSDGYGRSVAEAADYARGYLLKLVNPGNWRRLLAGRVQWRVVVRGFLNRLSPARRRHDRWGAVAAQHAAGPPGRPVPQLFVYGSADPLTRKHMPDYRREADQHGLDRRLEVIPGADHNFSSVPWSGRVVELVAAFVERIAAGRGAPDDVAAGNA